MRVKAADKKMSIGKVNLDKAEDRVKRGLEAKTAPSYYMTLADKKDEVRREGAGKKVIDDLMALA